MSVRDGPDIVSKCWGGPEVVTYVLGTNCYLCVRYGHLCVGGWGGIRTHGRLAPTPVFKTGALNRSATHPCRGKAFDTAVKEMAQGGEGQGMSPIVRLRNANARSMAGVPPP